MMNTQDLYRQKPKIKPSDLHQMSLRFNSLQQNTNDPDIEIMQGDFNFRYHYGGLSIHTSNVTEMQNTSSTVELPAGLSFNIIYKGKIDFCLAEKSFQLGDNTNGIECAAIALARPELMTRQLKRGMEVQKINVFAERTWLEARCNTQQSLTTLTKVFANHAQLNAWQADEETIHIANMLLSFDEGATFKQSLEHEYLSIRLITRCIAQLDAILNGHQQPPALIAQAESKEQTLKQTIDRLLLTHQSTQEMAQTLGISVSTLQRKFKSAFGLTIHRYCQQQRLELARSALVMKGISIGEAAYLAGYNHPSNFVSAFKKRFQITPAKLVDAHQMKP